MNRTNIPRVMTNGSITSHLLRFAFPIMFSSLFHLIYSLADTIIVGKFLGGNTLAAVSVTGNATYLMFSIVSGINMGSSVVLAQAYGSGNREKMKRVIATSLWVLGITAILFTSIGVVTIDFMLGIIQTPEEIFKLAKTYMLIIFFGMSGSIFYDWLASLLRAFGNSFIPLLCLIFSGVLNVILDLIFVLCFKMGIEGVAVATVISQILSGLICFVYTWKKYTVFHMKIAEMQLDISVLKHILVIGIPAAVQDSIITVSNMVLQGVLNTYGTTIVLAYGIVSKYELICMQVGDSLGSALSTFAGQNMGAGKIDRVVQSVKYTVFLNMAGYGIVSPIIFMLAEKCMYIFTNSKDAIVVGGEFLQIYAVFFIALGILILFQNFLRSVGDIRATIWMGVCEVISRTVFALLLPQLWGVNGLKFVSPFTWIVSMLLGMICYYSGEWKKKKML